MDLRRKRTDGAGSANSTVLLLADLIYVLLVGDVPRHWLAPPIGTAEEKPPTLTWRGRSESSGETRAPIC